MPVVLFKVTATLPDVPDTMDTPSTAAVVVVPVVRRTKPDPVSTSNSTFMLLKVFGVGGDVELVEVENFTVGIEKEPGSNRTPSEAPDSIAVVVLN
jgi:hypothetical protein